MNQGLSCVVRRTRTKVKLIKVKFSSEEATKAHRGNRCIALRFLVTSALDAVGGQRHAPRRFTYRNVTVPIV